MGTAMPHRVEPSFVIFDIQASRQQWASKG